MNLPLNLIEYEALARERLPQSVYDYYAGGAADECTLRGNRTAFERFWLRPRVLADVSRVDAGLELFGDRLSFPVLLAPTAFQRLAHPDGELATVRAAGAAGTVYVASTLATTPIEEVARAATGPVWFQLYVFRDRGISRELVQRAQAAGCRAVCLTVSVPVQGKRERDVRNGFQLPPDIEMVNFVGLRQERFPEGTGSRLEHFVGREFDPALTWDTVDWLRGITDLPVVLKGVMTPEDAALGAERGAAAIIVSNHGGRQLDGAEPTLLALPRIADAVGDRVPVLMDGGVRRGTEVVKALALGARAVLIGRPYLWGLAVEGQAGVERVLTLLRTEVERTMALLGRPRLASLERSCLVQASAPAAVGRLGTEPH